MNSLKTQNLTLSFGWTQSFRSSYFRLTRVSKQMHTICALGYKIFPAQIQLRPCLRRTNVAILLAFPSSTSTAKLAEIGISSSVFAILKKIKSDPIKRESGHLRILIPWRHFHTAMETRFDKLLNLSTNYRQKTFKKGLI